MRWTPLRILLTGYFSVILVGAGLLLLPWSRTGALSPLDALFTATSAVCVTGLIVKDTATFFTPFGKGVILALIQVGGLGYMSFATLALFALRRSGSLRMRILTVESFPELTFGTLAVFLRRLFKLVLFFEGAGALLLTLDFWLLWEFPLPQALGHGLFQAVSAFCNAGFSTFSTSLERFVADPLLNLTVMTLIVSGGLGVYVWEELYLRWVRQSLRKLSLHTRTVLAATSLLILIPALFFFLSETLPRPDLPLHGKALGALFTSITARTAGFDTLPMSLFGPSALFLLMFLMFVGGSPGGTAGGVKTTTFWALLAWLYAFLKDEEEAHSFGYRIPAPALRRAFGISTLGLLTVLLATFLTLHLERGLAIHRGNFPLTFEVISAFGTVGLSLGAQSVPHASLTADFSSWGKAVIIMTMFIGRVGVLSVAFSLVEQRPRRIFSVPGRYIVG